ncbi:hypothetical protein QUF90_21540 [Desulfococcaceae bacterium HSG9]|nr:hypothetical protein [Desulfococcaceae bacterium HSG9]
MDLFSVLKSKTGNETKLYYNFNTNDVELFTKNIADVYLVATEDGFSPLGASKEFLENDTGWTGREIEKLAYWNRFRNRNVTLVACGSKKKNSILRGFILCPCENSVCYQQFATPKYGKPYRDFYYNITYEAISYAFNSWNARKFAISHLSSSQNYHQDIATCHAEALAHFCDEQTAPSIESFSFIGCCISPNHLEGIKRLNQEGNITHHIPISVKTENKDNVILIHLSWES